MFQHWYFLSGKVFEIQPNFFSMCVCVCSQGHSRRLQVCVRPVQQSGTLPLLVEAVLSVSMGCVSARSTKLQRPLDSYQVSENTHTLTHTHTHTHRLTSWVNANTIISVKPQVSIRLWHIWFDAPIKLVLLMKSDVCGGASCVFYFHKCVDVNQHAGGQTTLGCLPWRDHVLTGFKSNEEKRLGSCFQTEAPQHGRSVLPWVTQEAFKCVYTVYPGNEL